MRYRKKVEKDEHYMETILRLGGVSKNSLKSLRVNKFRDSHHFIFFFPRFPHFPVG